MSRTIVVELYEYLELVGFERKAAFDNLLDQFHTEVKNMTDEEVAAYCDHYGIEFLEDGSVY